MLAAAVPVAPSLLLLWAVLRPLGDREPLRVAIVLPAVALVAAAPLAARTDTLDRAGADAARNGSGMATVDSAERRARLIGLLERDGAVRLDDAAAELDVSTMTVRRDLADLEAEGRLSRVRGGAVPALRPRPFAERLAAGAAAKREIARKAVALVPASGAIAVDASSTAGTLLGAAPESPQLLVATNSLENHASARRAARARAVLIGGELEEETDSFVGPLACSSAAELHYDRFFTSASAVSIDGTSEVTLQEAQVKRVFVASSSETVLLVDSTKLERTALARALAWDAISVMVTELDPADSRLEPFRGLVELR